MMNSKLFYALRISGRTFAEDAKEAGTVTLLGMVAIFTVLALLWLMIELLHRAMTKKTEQPKQEERVKSQPQKVPQSVASAEPVPAPAKADDGALIAAITAAISAAMADEGYTGGFRVVSFKRASVRRSGRG